MPAHLTQPLITCTNTWGSRPCPFCLSVSQALISGLMPSARIQTPARGAAFGVRLLSRTSFLPLTLRGPRK